MASILPIVNEWWVRQIYYFQLPCSSSRTKGGINGSSVLWAILDIFFVVFHTFLIFFNLVGWAWHATRRLNLATLLLTGASWFILGIWHGWGYCFCTDWHWQVLRKKGVDDLPYSYIQYLLERFFGIDAPVSWVNGSTAGFFFLALLLSVVLNIRDRWRRV